MTLEIHVLSLKSRAEKFRRLIIELGRQATSGVSVVQFVDSGELSQGRKRNILLERARSDYIVSVDDDDWVEPDYVDRLLEAIRSGPDVVTFRTRRYVDGKMAELIEYDLGEIPRPGAFVFYPTHICCWKREIAQRCRHAEDLAYGSDQCWHKALRLAGAAKTQKSIHKVLYHYLYSSSNDGAHHEPSMCMDAMKKMGPLGARSVWIDRSGMLHCQNDAEDGWTRLGEVRLG